VKTFLKQLREKVAELEARDDIVLLNWDVGEPATKDAIASVEKHLGSPLPASIRDIYLQADGLSLRWIHRDNPVFDAKKHRRGKGRLVPGFVRKAPIPEGLDVTRNSGADDGCICILPVREAFVDADWEGMLYFDDETDDEKMKFGRKSYGHLAFHRALRIFDFFSYYEMAAILMLEKSLPVIVGTDHGADWSAPATDFESYWEFVLSQYGSVHARSEAFIKSRYGQAELRPDARAASLDEALTVCRRGWQE